MRHTILEPLCRSVAFEHNPSLDNTLISASGIHRVRRDPGRHSAHFGGKNLYVANINFHGETPRNLFDRQNYAKAALPSEQDSFHARQRSQFDPGSLAYYEIFVGLWLALIDSGAQRLDLAVGQWPSLAS
jgi:hypothetical protein